MYALIGLALGCVTAPFVAILLGRARRHAPGLVMVLAFFFLWFVFDVSLLVMWGLFVADALGALLGPEQGGLTLAALFVLAQPIAMTASFIAVTRNRPQ